MMMPYMISGILLVAMIAIAIAPLWSVVSMVMGEVDD
jgi:hypothetical protein